MFTAKLIRTSRALIPKVFLHRETTITSTALSTDRRQSPETMFLKRFVYQYTKYFDSLESRDRSGGASSGGASD